MPDLITCIPRTLVPKKTAEEAAVELSPQDRPQPLAAVTEKLWSAPVRLKVGFLDDPSTELRRRILSHMNAWNKTADIEFTETEDLTDADVRINRQPTDDYRYKGYWSYLGTDILKYQGPYNQTMNLENFTMQTPDSEFYRVVRHEAGHTLGFHHEHMRPELVAKIDRDKAIAFYGKYAGWNPEQVDQQVLTPLDPAGLTATLNADPNSIMAYQVPGEITNDGLPIAGGLDIDASDYEFCGRLYPK